MRHRPQRAKPTEVTEWRQGVITRRPDDLATEEPLEIRVNDIAITVTMRTPGDDVELVAGFLVTEGIINGREDLEAVACSEESGNVVTATLRSGTIDDVARLQRHFVSSSACGICGKASIEAIRTRDLRPLNSGVAIDPALLSTMASKLRPAQAVFERTGALHAAALFDATGTLLVIREDVGRHNAVDKVIGHMLLAPVPPVGLAASPALSDSVLLVSGRAGFEIVQKAVAAGIPIVAAVSAPSSLAVQCAREFGLTLVGFLRGDRFVVYAGEKRLRLERSS